MESADVVTVGVEFVEGNQSKRRPVVVLNDDGNKIYFLRITTKYYNKSKQFREKYYYQVANWEQMGLYKQSYVDTYKVYTAVRSRNNTVKKIGCMDDYDNQELAKFIMEQNKKLEVVNHDKALV